MGRKIMLTAQDTAPAPPPRPAFRPTDEQAAILEAFQSGADLVVEAGAGSGKTSTLRLLARETPDRRGVYLAYNKAISEEAKATFPASVKAATAHSFAFGAVGRSYAHRLNGPRLPAWKTAALLDIHPASGQQYVWGLPLTAYHAARIVMETVDKFCHSADAEITASHVPFVNGLMPDAQLILREAAAPVAQRAWADLRDPDGGLRFSHDCYLKMWALGDPQLPGAYVMLDEAQDANPCIAQVVEHQQAQRILVGDSSQAIYGWRGAIDAMRGFAGARFPLQQSFRFGQVIADNANTWLERLKAPIRLRGSEADSRIGLVDEPHAILCRTNAGAVLALMKSISAGRRACLVRGGPQIRALAEAAISLQSGAGTSHHELFLFKTWDALREYVENDKAGQDLRTFVRLVDQYGPQAVIAVIDAMAQPRDADVVISTAHSAKGLEWDTVQIADDFLAGKDGPPLGEPEMMLSYVAVTRAKHAIHLGSLDPAYEPPSRENEERGL